MCDVDDRAISLTILLEEGGDGFARGGRVGAGELAVSVLVLGVDYDEGAVGGSGGGGRDADEAAEGGGARHCVGWCVDVVSEQVMAGCLVFQMTMRRGNPAYPALTTLRFSGVDNGHAEDYMISLVSDGSAAEA